MFLNENILKIMGAKRKVFFKGGSLTQGRVQILGGGHVTRGRGEGELNPCNPHPPKKRKPLVKVQILFMALTPIKVVIIGRKELDKRDKILNFLVLHIETSNFDLQI